MRSIAAVPPALALVLLALPAGPARGTSGPGQERVLAPSVPRFERSRSSAPDPNVALPDALVSPLRTGPREPPPDDDARELDEWARREAHAWVDRLRETALDDAARIGLWTGLDRALHDPWLGDDEARIGFDRGWNDADARREGADAGAAEAAAEASIAARTEVERRFRDLSREPRRPETPRPPPPPPPSWRLETDLDTLHWSGDFRTPHGWDDLDSFTRRGSWRDVWDGTWTDHHEAFRVWERRQRRGSLWERLDADEKGRVRVVFEHAFHRRFADRLRDGLARQLRSAYHRGLRDGWREGAWARAEREYRRGYFEGFEAAVRDEFDHAWVSVWAEVFAEEAAREMDWWSSRAVPEIRDVRLVDADGDGVVEPGEEVELTLAVANPGGADAWVGVEIRAEQLEEEIRDRIEIPRRSARTTTRPLRGRIAPDVPLRSTAVLRIGVGDTTTSHPVRIARPLELVRPLRLEVRDLATGAASIDVVIENGGRTSISRADVAAESSTGVAEPRTTGPLAGDGTTRVSLDVRNLDPLEILEGRVDLRVVVTAEDELHDRAEVEAERLGTRAGHEGLWDVLVAAARTGSAPDRTARLHALVLARIRGGWERAVAADGNPYKRDRRSGTAETELGRLVERVRSAGPLRDPRVVRDLVPRLEALSDDLPGAHPLLRRHFRRLLRELDDTAEGG